MRTFKAEGIIIKRKNYGEADRILTVLTRYHGKIQVKATGIRRIPSRRSAHVELLNHSLLSLYKGRSMPILTEAQAVESFSGIKEDMNKIGGAFHLCELVDGLCPENQENEKVFHMLYDMLDNLSSKIYQVNVMAGELRKFEVELLTALGFWNKADVLYDKVNTQVFIENIIERKLRSRNIFAKME